MDLKKNAQWLFRTPGNWDGEVLERRAEVLHISHLFIIIGSMVYLLMPASLLAGQTSLVLLTLVIGLAGSFLLRFGMIKSSGAWTVTMLWLMFTVGSMSEGGVQSSSFGANIVLIVFAGLTFGRSMVLVIALITIAGGGATVYLSQHHLLPVPALVYSEMNIFLDYTVDLILTALLTGIAIRRIDDSMHRAEMELRERRKIETALRESESENRAIVNCIPDLLFRINREGVIKDCRVPENLAASHDAAHYMGKTVAEILPPDVHGTVMAAIEDAIRTKTDVVFEYDAIIRGEQRRFEDRIVPLMQDEVLAVVRDITARQQADMQIKHSLEEKTVLLKEIHHRVKNNLQVITSLLSIQSDGVSDPAAKEIIRESKNRVRSMALVHERLYQSDNLARVHLQDYVYRVATSLISTYGRFDVQCIVNAEDVYLEIDTAIPCGLIINEMITNSLKHGFLPGSGGAITIGMRPVDGNMLELTASDNGVGISGSTDLNSYTSMGMTLITSLTEQLRGTIEVASNQGTHFCLRFPA
ncbi:MAG: PAS domain-containing protein [Ignavibacteriales bacterium]|nr:PAS domain-containing protein [Ignavibacteriales bacterium]